MTLEIPEGLIDRILELAAEDEIPVEELLANLINEEDRKRHIMLVPFGGAQRFRCGRQCCSEKRPRPDTFRAIET